MNLDWIDTAKWAWRLRAWLTIFVPLIGTAAALCWAGLYGVHASTTAVAVAVYAVATFGVTAGYHRYLTHRSFECGRTVKCVLTIFGCMAAQGPPLFWVAIHRLHHQHSDAEGDPHSPAPGRFGAVKALAHAHVGWMLAPFELPNYARVLPDLLRDREVVWIGRYYLVWVAAGILGPALLAAFITGGGMGFVEGLLFGGLLRICLGHHASWSVNSLAHHFGAHAYATNDGSRNLAWLALPTFGEAWHNNHRAFPTSARNGLEWWQLDTTYLALVMLRATGLISNLRLPSTHSRPTAQQSFTSNG